MKAISTQVESLYTATYATAGGVSITVGELIDVKVDLGKSIRTG